MEANGPLPWPWNGGYLNAQRRAQAELTFTQISADPSGTSFEAMGTVTYSATGTGIGCTLELLPTTLPVIGYLRFVSKLPSPVYFAAGGAAGLLDHKLSWHEEPPIVISMEAWPWFVAPFQTAPLDAATLAGMMTVGDATYTWSFARTPPPDAARSHVITAHGAVVVPR